MAEILPLRAACGACVQSEPVSLIGMLGDWLGRLVRRRRRLGNADELPERLRRDMGLAGRLSEPGRHYADYLSSHGR